MSDYEYCGCGRPIVYVNDYCSCGCGKHHRLTRVTSHGSGGYGHGHQHHHKGHKNEELRCVVFNDPPENRHIGPTHDMSEFWYDCKNKRWYVWDKKSCQYIDAAQKIECREYEGEQWIMSGDCPIVRKEDLKGAPGAMGATGPKGDQGIKGDKGDTGEQGIQGPKGDTGDQGPKGDPGDTGADGTPGVPGQNGSNGEAGSTVEPVKDADGNITGLVINGVACMINDDVGPVINNTTAGLTNPFLAPDSNNEGEFIYVEAPTGGGGDPFNPDALCGVPAATQSLTPTTTMFVCEGNTLRQISLQQLTMYLQGALTLWSPVKTNDNNFLGVTDGTTSCTIGGLMPGGDGGGPG